MEYRDFFFAITDISVSIKQEHMETFTFKINNYFLNTNFDIMLSSVVHLTTNQPRVTNVKDKPKKINFIKSGARDI